MFLAWPERPRAALPWEAVKKGQYTGPRTSKDDGFPQNQKRCQLITAEISDKGTAGN